jgi:hypothetical protein
VNIAFISGSASDLHLAASDKKTGRMVSVFIGFINRKIEMGQENVSGLQQRILVRSQV